ATSASSWAKRRSASKGCLQRQSGGEHERVVARAADDLNGLVSDRERERWPAERVEGEREARQCPPDFGLDDVGRRRRDRQGWREQQVEAVERRFCALTVPLACGERLRVLRVRDRKAALDLAADVLPVELAVLGVELAVHICHLA